MAPTRADDVSKLLGSDVQDEFGRVLGTLIAVESDIDGYVTSVTLKVADRGLETVEGERLKLVDGRLVIVPEWKHEITKLIDNLDRAFKRRKALDTMSNSSDLPDVVVEPIRKKLDDEIRVLKLKAEEVKKLVSSRIKEVEDEELKVARALATIRISYFSGEIGDRAYNQSVNHLRRLQDSLSDEKRSAKELLDRLDKVLQLASTPSAPESAKKAEAEQQAQSTVAQVAQVTPAQPQAAAQVTQPQQALVVKIEG